MYSFQNVQKVSPIGTSLRIIPTCILGLFLIPSTGRFIHLAAPVYPAVFTILLTSVSPLIMTFIDPAWSYWYAEFWSVVCFARSSSLSGRQSANPIQLLSSISGDVIYTIGLLIAADAFPEHCQGLAGAVFNVFYFLGGSIGLAVTDIILSSNKSSRGVIHVDGPELSGFRASSWFLFGLAIASAFLGTVGLRNVDRIGQK